MIKYYFICYMCQTEAGLTYSNCFCKIEDMTLNDICLEIASSRGISPKSVVITYLKDLSKKEYEMLKGGENE